MNVETAPYGDLELSLETGRVARQAHGAVVARHGDSFLLATVVAVAPVPGANFFPLTVEYRERMAATARIPGNFFRRETRQGEREILVSRLVDRALRPLFPKDFRGETQIQITVYSADERSDLEGLAITAAAAALAVSDVPFGGPVAGRRWVTDDLDVTLGATRDGLVMAEGSCALVTDEALLDALDEARSSLAPALDAIEALATRAGRPNREYAPLEADPDEATRAHELQAAALAGERADGRGPSDIRPIDCEAGLLPGSHGSALFTRGDTQVLVTATLGGAREGQDVETLWGMEKHRFLLHYNFPPFSVGDVRPLRSPGRRELGHGSLAQRALAAVMPDDKRWPYTTRVVSDVTESNGSSSMATVCGGTLALLDAGVPLAAPVAGIAMGLVAGDDRFSVLSDILGAEDQLGHMDFKVAGTADRISALQLDNKLGALNREVLAAALAQASAGRAHILTAMQPTIDAIASRPAEERRMARVEIPTDRIGELIGPGGKNLQGLQSRTDTRIDVANDGVVLVLGKDARSTKAAVRELQRFALVLKKGGLYLGEVVSIKDFGAFVRVADHEALVHSSEGGGDLTVGAEVLVRVLGADDKGRLKLSASAAKGARPEDALNA